LGVTPSAWYSTWKAIQGSSSGNAFAIASGGNGIYLLNNSYLDASATFRYKTSDYASYYQQVNSQHAWYTAPSGTAGNAITFTQAMTLTASGDLGIGATSSLKKLTVQGSTSDRTVEVIDNGSNDAAIMLQLSGVQEFTLGVDRTDSSFRISDAGALGTNDRLVIDTSGNVGVGTTSPAQKLHVKSSGATKLLINSSDNSADRGVYFASSTDSDVLGYISQEYSTGNFTISAGTGSYSVPMIFKTSGSERARIDSSGALLVGFTSISSTGANGVTSGGFAVSGDQTNGGASVADFYNASGSTSSDSSPPITIRKGVGTTSSSARFVQFYASGSGTAMGGIVGNGSANVQFATLSDAREKTNVQPISGSLEKITALNPVEFDWIKSGEHVNSGFIAQDVEQIFPEFVVENMSDDGQESRKGLTGGMTGGIIPHLVKALQEQQAIIESLTQRIATLEAK
jgi:hypothetical protein